VAGCLAYSLTRMMEAVCSSETSANFYRTTQHHRCENLTSNSEDVPYNEYVHVPCVFVHRLNNYEIISESITPEFKFEADYVLDGQLLVLPVKGKGKCIISLGKLIIHHQFYISASCCVNDSLINLLPSRTQRLFQMSFTIIFKIRKQCH
jgi:hypothetical protein